MAAPGQHRVETVALERADAPAGSDIAANASNAGHLAGRVTLLVFCALALAMFVLELLLERSKTRTDAANDRAG